MYTKPKKCALKCHRCNRMGHRVKDCTIPKRKKDAGGARAPGVLTPVPEHINHVTSVWDEFPEIKRPNRADHVTSVWDELEIVWDHHSPQQGFPQPRPRRTEDGPTIGEEPESEEEWFEALETQDGRTDEGAEDRWGNFPETMTLFEETTEPEQPVLAPHEMEQQFLAERWEEVHFVFR